MSVAAAARGTRVLVVSTDPAHSLGDALGCRLSGRTQRVDVIGRRGSTKRTAERALDAIELRATKPRLQILVGAGPLDWERTEHVLGNLAPPVSTPANIRGNAEGGLKEKGALASFAYEVELSRQDQKHLLRGVGEIGLVDAEPTQRSPGEIDVVVDERPPAGRGDGPGVGPPPARARRTAAPYA